MVRVQLDKYFADASKRSELRAKAVNNWTSCDPAYLAAVPEVGVSLRKRSDLP